MMTDISTEAWERIGRGAVAERIEADAHDIDETFEAIAAAIRLTSRICTSSLKRGYSRLTRGVRVVKPFR